MSTYGLTLSGVTLPGEQDPLGICAVEPPAFAADGRVEVPTWRIDLPSSPEAAQAILAQTTRLLQQREDNLDVIRRELDSFSLEGDGVSFSVATGVPARFAAQKDALRSTLGVYSVEEEMASYGLKDLFKKKEARPETLSQDDEDYNQWTSFVQQVEQMVTHYARVETAIAGYNLIGLTRVGWTGNFHTTWKSSAPSAFRKIHLQSVNVALASRIALMHVVAVVVGGAAGLATKATALPPGGQVLLLPSAWRFVRDVLKVLQEV
ncbi:MAG: hypothetical protein JXA33_11065 [Anaerolineae bacterium]|nr:hypothetical protein [Anaerolineae bacterium]